MVGQCILQERWSLMLTNYRASCHQRQPLSPGQKIGVWSKIAQEVFHHQLKVATQFAVSHTVGILAVFNFRSSDFSECSFSLTTRVSSNHHQTEKAVIVGKGPHKDLMPNLCLICAAYFSSSMVSSFQVIDILLSFHFQCGQPSFSGVENLTLSRSQLRRQQAKHMTSQMLELLKH